MKDQPDLFDQPPPRPRARNTDPWTSKVAAAAVEPVASRHYRIILGALKQGPGTQLDIAARSGLDHHQINKRLPEMKDKGWVRLTGESARGPRGMPCRIWAAL